MTTQDKPSKHITRRILLAIAVVLILAGLSAGLKYRNDTSKQHDKVATESAEAVEAVQEYSYAQKAEFVAAMKTEQLEIQNELDRLAMQANKSRAEARAEAEAKLEAARAKLKLAQQKLDDAAIATESVWDDVRKGFKTSRDELKDSIATTRQWLSDKIEP